MTQQPTRVKIALRQLGPGNWGWRLLDYFYHEVERGAGCRTRDEAMNAAGQARQRYFECLEFPRRKIILKN